MLLVAVVRVGEQGCSWLSHVCRDDSLYSLTHVTDRQRRQTRITANPTMPKGVIFNPNQIQIDGVSQTRIRLGTHQGFQEFNSTN